MAIADLTYVRNFTRIPDGVSDDLITPHLVSASAEVRRLIPDYEEQTGSGTEFDRKQEAYKSAESAITMYFILPNLNTLFPTEIRTATVTYGDMEFNFHNVDDVAKLRGLWWSRAMHELKPYIDEDNEDLDIGFAI